MLTYKAAYKFVDGGVHTHVVGWKPVPPRIGSLTRLES